MLGALESKFEQHLRISEHLLDQCIGQFVLIPRFTPAMFRLDVPHRFPITVARMKAESKLLFIGVVESAVPREIPLLALATVENFVMGADELVLGIDTKRTFIDDLVDQMESDIEQSLMDEI